MTLLTDDGDFVVLGSFLSTGVLLYRAGGVQSSFCIPSAAEK